MVERLVMDPSSHCTSPVPGFHTFLTFLKNAPGNEECADTLVRPVEFEQLNCGCEGVDVMKTLSPVHGRTQASKGFTSSGGAGRTYTRTGSGAEIFTFGCLIFVLQRIADSSVYRRREGCWS